MDESASGGALPSPEGEAERSSPRPSRAPVPVAPDEPPPFGGRWSTLYAVVLGTLALLIVLFYAFTKAFE